MKDLLFKIQQYFYEHWRSFRLQKRSDQQKAILVFANILCALLTAFIFIPTTPDFKINTEVNSLLLSKRSIAYIYNLDAGDLENVTIHVYAFSGDQNKTEQWIFHSKEFEEGSKLRIHQKQLRNVRGLAPKEFLEFARIDVLKEKERIYFYNIPKKKIKAK